MQRYLTINLKKSNFSHYSEEESKTRRNARNAEGKGKGKRKEERKTVEVMENVKEKNWKKIFRSNHIQDTDLEYGYDHESSEEE